MVEAYPEALPADPLINGYRESWVSNFFESATDSGKPRRMKRYTKPPRQTLNVTVPMTRAEVAIFETWFWETLEGGLLPFSFVHPRRNTLLTFWFRKDTNPDPKPVKNGANWDVTYELEFERG